VRGQSIVYAVEFNQSTNRFGTIDLLNGNFTRISSIGKALINDIAYCPTNGTLYGISNSSVLVTFNKTSGAITKVANLSVSGIQSLAFRPSNGTLFGATQTGLYRINPVTGMATPVGSYGSPRKLGSTGQNIRFAQDGNLYVSNTSTNTDIYRINTATGAATWMGEAVGYPYLMLMNASSNMYGVFINLGSSGKAFPRLAAFDPSSFVNGGTNANGSTHQITIKLVGAGTNFPANFNFSGNVPQAITNLTVAVSATGPVSQTVCPGNTVVFSTVASGTPPYGYVWLKNGSALSSQTNSSLTLANVNVSDVATYSVIVSGAMGKVTNSATLTIVVPPTVNIVNPADGAALIAPAHLTVLVNVNPGTCYPTGAVAKLAAETVAKVELFAGTNKVGETTSGDPYSIELTNVPPGKYPLTAKATDALGIAATSPSVNLIVLDLNSGSGWPITSARSQSDQTFKIDFASELNRVYVVQYSSDLQHWKTVQTPLVGTGTLGQWIDHGPPDTDSAPATQAQRFYRLRELATP
jgi:hypothetical protein